MHLFSYKTKHSLLQFFYIFRYIISPEKDLFISNFFRTLDF